MVIIVLLLYIHVTYIFRTILLQRFAEKFYLLGVINSQIFKNVESNYLRKKFSNNEERQIGSMKYSKVDRNSKSGG